jgi:hypothetical protein
VERRALGGGAFWVKCGGFPENAGQSYDKSGAKQRNTFLFLPRESKFDDLSATLRLFL